MMSRTPWRLQGIEPAARANAEFLARRAGVSVEQWLNSLIHQSSMDHQAPPPQQPSYAPAYAPPAYPPQGINGQAPQMAGAAWNMSNNNAEMDLLHASIHDLSNQIEHLTRQNMATSVSAPQPMVPETASGASEDVDQTLRSIVDLVEASNRHTNQAIKSLETKVVRAASAVDITSPAPALEQPSHPEPSELVPEPTEHVTRFMARKERRRRRFQGAGDSSNDAPIAQPAQQAPTLAASNADMESLLTLAQSVQESLATKQADHEATHSGMSNIRGDIQSLSEQFAESSQQNANDEEFAKLQHQINLISNQFENATAGMANLGDLDRKVSMLFDRLEQTRQTIENSNQNTAQHTRDQIAREVNQAAIQTVAEQVAQQLPDSVAGHESALVQGLEDNLKDLRADVSLTDERSLDMFDQVQTSLRAIQKQLDDNERQQTTPSDVPRTDHAPSAQTTQTAQANAPTLLQADPEEDIELTAAQIIDPPLPTPKSGPTEPASVGNAHASRPRAPGSGRPDATQRLEAESTIPAQRVTPAVNEHSPSPVEAARPNPTGQALKSATTNEELLAAARSAARSASNGNPVSKNERKKTGMRGRISERTSNFRRERAAAGKANQTNNGAAEIAPPEEAASSGGIVRKSLVLASAAVLLFVGSVQVYDILNKHGEQTASAPRAPVTTRESPDIQNNARPDEANIMGESPMLDGRQSLQQFSPNDGEPPTSEISDEPATVRIIPAPGQETIIDGGGEDVTGSLPATMSLNATQVEAASMAPVSEPIESQPLTAPVTEARGSVPPSGTLPAAIRNAAASGDVVAQFEIASRLVEGRGTDAEPTAAIAWYQMAAAQGLAPAQYRLGSMYDKGLGVTADKNTAQVWYLRAAEQGNRKAMHNLAVLYSDGIAGEPDLETAAQWFRKAADYGLNDSQFNLGVLYARGMGVPQNLAEAYKWLSIAAENGDSDAAGRRDAITSDIDEQSLVAARLAAQTWRATPLRQNANVVELPVDGWGAVLASTDDTPLPGADIIRNAQKLLSGLGFTPGAADGVWGPNTERAIVAFQSQNQIPETGRLTPALLRSLQQISS